MNTDNKSNLQETVFKELVDHLYKALPSAVFATIFIAAVLVAVLWQNGDPELLADWFLLIGFINIARLFLYLAYNRQDPETRNTRHWDYAFYFLLILTGLCWSAVSIWLLPHNSSIYHYFPLMVLIGMSGGSVTSLSYSMRNIITYLALVLLPLLVNEILVGSFLSYAVAWLTVIFIIYTTVNAKLFHRTYIENITLRYESEKNKKELTEIKDAAIAANSAKSSFISMISHELRTPLNAILGFSQLLKMSDTPELNQEQHEHTQGIINSGKHLLSLIEELLDLSKIEADKLDVDIHDVSLNDALHESIILLSTSATKDKIKLINNVSDGYIVKADYKRLKQIIINLLSNAIKYNNVNGEVNIDVSVSNQNRIRVNVSDTGSGLTAAQIQKLYEPFKRFNNTKEGIGLGLYIARQLVFLMQGETGVESELNKGSIFWFELPLVEKVEKLQGV